MTLQVFLTLLMLVSIFTGLFTEGIKNLLKERNKTYHANALAGYVAVVLAILAWAGYTVLFEAVLNAQMVVFLIALILLSWLAAMVGYDKVIQAIAQFKNK